jgi:regulatory protein YycH of two-component signal transduction system YycFG
MSPQRKGSKRGSGWKPPRDRREVRIAILAALAVIVVTAALIWFLRPNRDSGSTTTSETVTTPTTVAPTTVTPTTVTPTTVTPTTAPAATSTP